MINLVNYIPRIVSGCEAIINGIVNKIEIDKDIKAYKVPGKGGYVLRIDIKIRDD